MAHPVETVTVAIDWRLMVIAMQLRFAVDLSDASLLIGSKPRECANYFEAAGYEPV